MEILIELLLEIVGGGVVGLFKKDEKSKRHFLAIRRKKGNTMKNTDLTPFVGSEVKIFDALGNLCRGKLENISDTAVTIIDKNYTKTIFALEHIAKVVVE